MLVPANAGSGESLLVTARSALVATVVVAVPVLLAGVGSVVVLAAVALLLMVAPFAVLALTFTTIVNTADYPAATAGLANTTLPVPPTEGAVGVQPTPVVTTADTNVVFARTASVTVTIWASLGPAFVKLTV